MSNRCDTGNLRQRRLRRGDRRSDALESLELCLGHGLALAQVLVVAALLFLAVFVDELDAAFDRGTADSQAPGHLMGGVGYFTPYQREAFFFVQVLEDVDLFLLDLSFNPFDFGPLLHLHFHPSRHLA